jgi:diguanylate cyclase (GGDEF)-like protein
MSLRLFSLFRKYKDTRMFLVQLGLIISLFISVIFFGIYLRSNSLAIETAIQEAESYFDLIIRVRLWNEMLDGVYVKKRPGVQANPYLKIAGIDPDIQCSNGVYTLRNASIMTSEIFEKTLSPTRVYFRMVSLKPINPINSPDGFEKAALNAFGTGIKSLWEIDRSAQEPVFRYIAPLYVEQACMKCHSSDDLKVGSIRGAISINMPFGHVARNLRDNELILAGVCILTIGLLLGIVYFLGWRLTGKLERAQRRLTEMATTDELTKLLNRREVMSRLSEQFQRTRRNNEVLGMILLDLDHFKRINDTYGHPFGDIVLSEAAARIRGSVRVYDMVGRFGGEEFLVICPNIDTKALMQLAERLRLAVKAAPISDDRDSVTISVSAGISVLNIDDPTPDMLLSRVDRALYEAKFEGRDRVVFL